MNFKRVVSTMLAGVLLSVSSLSVLAADSGAYWGFNFGFTPLSSDAAAGITTSTGFGMGGDLGYRINRNVAVEAAINGMGVYGWKAGAADVFATVLSGTVIGSIPVKERMDVYVKLGYANASVSQSVVGSNVSKSITGLTYGVGVELRGGEKASIRFGIDHYDLSAFTGVTMGTYDLNLAINTAF